MRLGELLRDFHELAADDLQALALEPRQYLAGEPALDRVGLEDDERPLHVKIPFARVGGERYTRRGGRRKIVRKGRTGAPTSPLIREIPGREQLTMMWGGNNLQSAADSPTLPSRPRRPQAASATPRPMQ